MRTSSNRNAVRHHVAEHARAGELGMEHHPGMHQGSSPCAKELHMPGV